MTQLANAHKADYYVRNTKTGDIYSSIKEAAVQNNMGLSALTRWIEQGIPMRDRNKQHFEPVAIEDVDWDKLRGPRSYPKKGPDSLPDLEVGELLLISANGRLIMHDKSIRGLSGRTNLSRGVIARMLQNGASDDLGRTVGKVLNEFERATICGE